MDRRLPIRLERKGSGDSVERFKERRESPRAGALCERIEAWVADNLDALRDAEPGLPEILSDRAQEVVEPLIAIADLAGGEWPVWIRLAAVAVLKSTEPDEMDIATQLLEDIRTAFDNGNKDAMFTATLLHLLSADDERPWASWRDGRRDPSMNPRDLSGMLKRFRIRPKTVRVGTETAKGYQREQFAEAWRRYLAG